LSAVVAAAAAAAAAAADVFHYYLNGISTKCNHSCWVVHVPLFLLQDPMYKNGALAGYCTSVIRYTSEEPGAFALIVQVSLLPNCLPGI
jgi:hypothetical protein